MGFIDVIAITLNYIIPLTLIILLVIFVVKKLNSIERNVKELENLINKKNKLDN